MKRFFLIFALFAAPVLAQVGGDNSAAVNAINRIPLEGSEELDRALADPAISVTDKRYAIRRLGQLSGQLQGSGYSPSKLYNPLLGVLTPQPSVQDHYLLREAACNALANFAKLDGSEQLVGPLGKILRNGDEREEVRMAAARTLGQFSNNSTAATEQLVAALDQEMDRGPTPTNVNLATGIVASLGRLGDKRSFVPLMRVIKSRFPTQTKRRAEESLDSIRWK